MWILSALASVLVLVSLGFVAWASTAAQPMPEALSALQSDSQVTVSHNGWWVFEPAGGMPSTGLIFYPGAKVDPRAYAPAAHKMAAGGYLVVIPPMPLNLAIFAPGKASDVLQAYPDIKHWAVGGHSLGGAMAAQFAHDHPGEVQGLVLWAAYPPDSSSLSAYNGKVVSISGTNDGLATTAKVEASHKLLPADTRYVVIQGGNHAQFGWYGSQDGDNPATTSREDQQMQIVEATEGLLQSLK